MLVPQVKCPCENVMVVRDEEVKSRENTNLLKLGDFSARRLECKDAFLNQFYRLSSNVEKVKYSDSVMDWVQRRYESTISTYCHKAKIIVIFEQTDKFLYKWWHAR